MPAGKLTEGQVEALQDLLESPSWAVAVKLIAGEVESVVRSLVNAARVTSDGAEKRTHYYAGQLDGMSALLTRLYVAAGQDQPADVKNLFRKA